MNAQCMRIQSLRYCLLLSLQNVIKHNLKNKRVYSYPSINIKENNGFCLKCIHREVLIIITLIPLTTVRCYYHSQSKQSIQKGTQVRLPG